MSVQAVGSSWSAVWRATRTPNGAACLLLEQRGDTFYGFAWGPGADWCMQTLPGLLGGDDTGPAETTLAHAIVGPIAHRYQRLRIGKTLRLWEALVPAVLEQRVTGVQARASFRKLVHAQADPAPRANGGPELLLPLSPSRVDTTPSHYFRAAGVEGKRADALRRIAHYADRLDDLAASGELADLTKTLLRFPGIGLWTVAEATAAACGDADAVSIGDFHVKNVVSWALAGEARGTDERMLELLQPFAGDRGRVIKLLHLGGITPPKFGPRLTIQNYPEHRL